MLIAVLVALLPAAASAHPRHMHPVTARIAQAGDLTTPCPGAPIRVDQAITGRTVT